MCKTTILECKYCDGTMSHTFMDVRCCISCGAEWDPVEVQVEAHESSFTSDCSECYSKYSTNDSDAQDRHGFCSSHCEERWNHSWCECCNKQYDARESSSNEPFTFCTMECEISQEIYEQNAVDASGVFQ